MASENKTAHIVLTKPRKQARTNVTATPVESTTPAAPTTPVASIATRKRTYAEVTAGITPTQSSAATQTVGQQSDVIPGRLTSMAHGRKHAEENRAINAQIVQLHPMFSKIKTLEVLLANLKKLDTAMLKKQIAGLDTAFADFKKTAGKDRASFNILSGELLLILKNAKKEMASLRDPMSVRIHNAFVGVIAAFLHLLDRFQAYVLQRPMIDSANRVRFFEKKPAPVQDVKDALQNIEKELKTMNKVLNAVVEQKEVQANTPAPK